MKYSELAKEMERVFIELITGGPVKPEVAGRELAIAVTNTELFREIGKELRYYRGRAAVAGKPESIMNRDELLWLVRELQAKLEKFDRVALNMLMDARRGDSASVVAAIEKLYVQEDNDAQQA